MVVAITISCAVAECELVDPCPVTKMLYVPWAAVPALMFSVVEPPVVTGLDVNEPDAPFGSPLSCKEIGSGLPEITAVLTV